MTREQQLRLDELIEKHRYCFIVHGHFHSRSNDRRMEKFVNEKRPSEYEFLRITADTTFVFWTPSKVESV